MLMLTNRYAKALLEYADEKGLNEIYRQALLLVAEGGPVKASQVSGALGEFLQAVPEGEIVPVLYRFLDLARDRLDLIKVEVISAVPLTEEQLYNLEVRLIGMFRKQLEITTRLDPSLLGGLRVIAGNTVLDDTVKRKLMDMKISVYKGVYLKQ